MWFVYIAKCCDDTLYTGITNNIEERIKTHNSGKGGAYTRGRIPVELVYSEKAEDKGKALSREYEIKQLTREEKLELIAWRKAHRAERGYYPMHLAPCSMPIRRLDE